MVGNVSLKGLVFNGIYMKTRNNLLDVYRFIAAIMVVIYHYAFNGIANGKVTEISYILEDVTKYGYLGVELFFIISGFVIYNSISSSTPSRFITSRFLRLYPAYWFCLIFTSIVIIIFGMEFQFNISLYEVLVNFTMFQQLLGVDHVDGVYWTLTYELLFYLLIFMIFFLSNQKILQSFFIIWPYLLILMFILDLDALPFMGGYFYFFSSGVIISMICRSRKNHLYLSLCILLFLSINYSIGNADKFSVEKNIYYSHFVVSFIIVLFFLIMFALRFDFINNLKIPYSEVMGKITYPLYLMHAHIGYITLNMYGNDENKWVLVPCLILSMILVSFIIHKVIEDYMQNFWKSAFENVMLKPITSVHVKYLQLKKIGMSYV